MSDEYDPQFNVLDYIDLVDRLTGLLNTETDLLDAGRPQEITALQIDKRNLSAAVRQSALAIIADPGILDDGSEYAEADRLELQDAVSALNQAAADNERALRAAIRSTDRLVKAVVLATSEARGGRDNRYTAMGTTGARKRSLNLRAVDQVS
jgi:acetylglutamate kinase